MLQKIEEVLSEKRFISISAFAGTGKSTLVTEYGRRQKENIRKIVRFINADSADKVLGEYRQLAEELGINVREEKEEEIIIRLVCNKIAGLDSNTFFIFDNAEKYKDIEPYIKGIMNISKDKTQAIITTRHNNLSEDITNIKLKPFNIKTAITYLENSLGNRLSNQDISNLIKELGSKDEILPYSLSKAVAYLKENKLLKVKDYINYLHNGKGKDNQPETILLLEILEKSPLAWQILQYSAHLDPDFIGIEIFKKLFLLDEKTLQEPIKRLEALSLMNLINQNGHNGLQLHRLVQGAVRRYANRHKEHVIDKKEIYKRLAKTLDNLFPRATNELNEDWESAKMLYPHVIKILRNNVKIDKSIRVNLVKKISRYMLFEIADLLKDSLKYQGEVLKISQGLCQLSQCIHNNMKSYIKTLILTLALSVILALIHYYKPESISDEAILNKLSSFPYKNFINFR